MFWDKLPVTEKMLPMNSARSPRELATNGAKAESCKSPLRHVMPVQKVILNAVAGKGLIKTCVQTQNCGSKQIVQIGRILKATLTLFFTNRDHVSFSLLFPH